MPESPRIAELRRRVDADPSSIAFAQLAEEYRRAGNYQAAELCCRTGLTRHPSYLSARVTLGRTLIELDKLEEAENELNFVLKSAPDNLAAIRGMAEIHQRRGNLELALDFYRRALPLARHDPEIEETVKKINRDLGASNSKDKPGLSFKEAQDEFLNALNQLPAIKPAAHPPSIAQANEESFGEASRTPRLADARSGQAAHDASAAPPAPSALSAPRAPSAPEVEAGIDFDGLLKSLGVPEHQPPPAVEALLREPEVQEARPEPVLPELPLNAENDDRFAELERGLRDFDHPVSTPEETPSNATLGYGEFSFDTAPAYAEAPAEPAVPYGERFPEASDEAPALAPVALVASEPEHQALPPAPERSVDGTEEHILDELEAWLAAIKR
jgi:tetratricopeptide (TPR) repeat protein